MKNLANQGTFRNRWKKQVFKGLNLKIGTVSDQTKDHQGGVRIVISGATTNPYRTNRATGFSGWLDQYRIFEPCKIICLSTQKHSEFVK